MSEPRVFSLTLTIPDETDSFVIAAEKWLFDQEGIPVFDALKQILPNPDSVVVFELVYPEDKPLEKMTKELDLWQFPFTDSKEDLVFLVATNNEEDFQGTKITLSYVEEGDVRLKIERGPNTELYPEAIGYRFTLNS
jgi:hypothetical protein